MCAREITRRGALGGTAALALLPIRSQALPSKGDTFEYEVQRSPGEWREILTDREYAVLREGDTELPKSTDLWNQTAAGTYCCRGCQLPLYASDWKVPVDIGWAFFRHSEPNAILMGIDDHGVEAYGTDPNAPPALIETHCRRCGSHLGHILLVMGDVLHCTNGTALQFAPKST